MPPATPPTMTVRVGVFGDAVAFRLVVASGAAGVFALAAGKLAAFVLLMVLSVLRGRAV